MYPGSKSQEKRFYFKTLSGKLALRAATYKGDDFYMTLAPMSKEAFLIDAFEVGNTH